MRLKSSLLWSLTILVLAGGAAAQPKYKILHAFTGGDDGGGLFGSLLLDASGNLYGVTRGGGTHIYGTVFELSPSSKGHWKETVLYNFCALSGCADGAGGWAGLASDAAGDLYGATTTGGSSDQGVVFELTPGSGGWSYEVIYEGGSSTGWILDKAGNLYGFTGPGAYGDGAVAELSPGSDGWTYNVLFSFDVSKDGYDPQSAMIFDTNGNLYGTTKYSQDGNGTAFKLMPPAWSRAENEWTEDILHDFRGSSHHDGQLVYAGLVFDQSGDLYGATEAGGVYNKSCPGGCGTVFKLSPGQNGHWKETVLHYFADASRGAGPLGTLVFDGAGNLYGTTVGGGKGQQYCGGGCGVVFKMTPNAGGKWKYTVVHYFDGQNGAGPWGALIVDPKGNLYGTTQYGGSGYAGVAFEITP
jgi:uncharacterized repeat protein (TIGR03803 family)